ncbi:MAG: AAA family ATPase [Elusimicrobiales bacterium]
MDAQIPQEILLKWILKPDFSKIPAFLKRLHRWVLWRLEPRQRADGSVEWAKVPYLGVGRRADASRGPWLTFEQAKAVFENNPAYFHGLGIALGETPEGYLSGVDLDDCLEPLGGAGEPSAPLRLLPWAARVLEECGGYAEVSPSRTGVKVFLLSREKFPASKKLKHVELYSEGRFFTVTGFAVVDRPARPEALEQLFSRVALVDFAARATAGEFGEKVRKLFRGEWQGLTNSKGLPFESESEADESLCVHLARAGKTPEEVDFLFRLSGLYDEKWDEPGHRAEDGATYGQMTVEKAFELVGAGGSGPGAGAGAGTGDSGEREFVLRTFAEVEHEFCAPRFLVKPLLPRGEITLLDGDKGVGKTWVCLALAAGLTGSKVCPVPYDHTAPRDAKVLILTAEDDPRKTLGPRLKALGADLARVAFFELKGGDESLTTGVTAAELERVLFAIREYGPDLIIVDHIVIYESTAWDLAASRAPLAVTARRVLDRLLGLARELDCAVLVVRHFRKKGGSARERGAGSYMYAATARSHLLIGRHPTIEKAYCLQQLDVNLDAKLEKALLYALDEDEWPPFKWLGMTEVPADALTNPQVAEKLRREEAERGELAEALLEVLGSGEEVESGEVYREVRKLTGKNYSDRYIRKAAKDLGVIARQEGFGKEKKSFWRLPPARRPGNPEENPPQGGDS